MVIAVGPSKSSRVPIFEIMHPANWTSLDRSGLFVKPGGFYVDPEKTVPLAVITHGHADHARRGHGTVVADAGNTGDHAVSIREKTSASGRSQWVSSRVETIGDVEITFYPAGHVLGSVQLQVNHKGQRLGVSGDYKRGGGDPTCADFEPVPCDVFLTEATFAYPLFIFPDPWD